MTETLQAFVDAIPFARACGMRVVEASETDRTLRMEMPLADQLQRAEGSRQFHGGAIAALIDTAATFAMVMVSEKAVPTINLRTDFLRPATDTTLSAEARVRRVGRTVGVVDVEVTNEGGEIVAIGRGTFGA